MKLQKHQRLYINIDHVATLRQARRGAYPDPVEAVSLCLKGGADGITAHLREDRRHIQDDDIERLGTMAGLTFNLEMAATDELIGLALRLKPHEVTLVPERRQEVTTEGGLHVAGHRTHIAEAVARLNDGGIKTSLFIDPVPRVLDVSREIGAAAVELHTGTYAHAPNDPATLQALRDAARHGASIGLAVHAGHGLAIDNIAPVAAIPEIEELNIGHAVVGRAVFVGIEQAVRELRRAMDDARAGS
ncbi:MAG TPA: pyridoxine 5'-phosphate synthase [Gemmatimonadaceae bacterium]|nr:pyridoxine 5'-phosphate synthase [Gemmatimonadaceae bacterium]